MKQPGCIIGSALCLVLGAPYALAQNAPVRAPAEACAGKLDAIASGASQNVEADVQWLGMYCDAATKAQAVDLIASATAENAMAETLAARQSATAQARGDIGGINAAAGEANAEIATGAIASIPAPAPGVLVVAPPPRRFAPPPPRSVPRSAVAQ